jgi:hypothetical protein
MANHLLLQYILHSVLKKPFYGLYDCLNLNDDKEIWSEKGNDWVRFCPDKAGERNNSMDIRQIKILYIFQNFLLPFAQ